MESHKSRRVQILRDSVASKIAAGEVIDRPFSILREFLDNSLDSGALNIEVRILEGGVKTLEVRDDGCGMTREDLNLCWHPHATSKITSETDLDTLQTLGFRGEALSAVAACVRLTVETTLPDQLSGFRLVVDHSQKPEIQIIPGTKGTKVRSEDLFFSIPARRRFLKSSGAEALACQKTLEEKALAFPEVSFKFYVEDKLKLHFPVETPLKRLYRIFHKELAVGMMDEVHIPAQGFSLTVFTSRPGLNRSDRKLIHIYANRRKIQEYAFVQAVGYAYGEFLPGGMFPCSFVFLTVDPDLVDFNIHPAKKEARFRNQQKIHSVLVEGLRQHLAGQRIQSPMVRATEVQKGLFDQALSGNIKFESHKSTTGDNYSKGPNPYSFGAPGKVPPGVEEPGGFFQAYKRAVTLAEQPASDASPQGYKYLGQIMGVFLVVDWGDKFFLVDQHAAHERILYEDFIASAGRTQALLIPLDLRPEQEAADILRERILDIRNLGIILEEKETGVFTLTHIPEKCQNMEGEIWEFLISQDGSLADLKRNLFARMSCRAAVMDGDILEPDAAISLIDKAFKLTDARCPHGRPVWMEFSKTDLYRMFGRIV